MKYLLFICGMLFSMHATMAQCRIYGTITDQNHHPLPGATVFVPDLNKGTAADSSGHYEMNNLPKGKIRIAFSFIGFSNQLQTLMTEDQSTKLNIPLQQTSIEAEEIVVSGGYNSTQHENAVKIEVLKLNTATTQATPNLSEVLRQVPGVDMISKGSGISKPVIRGMSMNDILVLDNGVRYENYQYSDHHPLGIDEFGVSEVEVIKGPASLLYGSDAIGGVINFLRESPAATGTFRGDYNLQLFSNTLGMTQNLGVGGASNKGYFDIRAGIKSNADFLQGGGEFAPNTRFHLWSVKANTGRTGKAGNFNLSYEQSRQKLGLAEEEALAAIPRRGRKLTLFYQQLDTHLLSSQNKLYAGKMVIDLNAAWQLTSLAHIGDPGQYEIQMNLGTLTYEAKLHLPASRKSEYIVGIQGFRQINTNVQDRETLLLPDATTTNGSLFALLQHAMGEKIKLQTGLRYDHHSLNSATVGNPIDSSSYRPSLAKNYNSFNGAFGFTWNLQERLLLRSNLATAYRTPNLAELTSKGPHELRFELGDGRLTPEKSVEYDLSLHYHAANVTFDLAGFYNFVSDYLYIAPTALTSASGLPIYAYKQQDARLKGMEAGLHIHPQQISWLHFRSTFSLVEGKQIKGDYLPFVPAAKLRFELEATCEEMGLLKQPFLALHTVTAFDQNHVAPDESATPGYTLTDFKVGGTIPVGKQPIQLSFGINNLLDVRYTDHLSTLKEVHLLNPGRDIGLSLRIPFGGKM
ncbi:MAG: TonB-dependent receptor [Marinilabiliales bacterium]|nr:TonB-dependent receptor [Marinilabiliales bacterium]